jgi:hypothetical protein
MVNYESHLNAKSPEGDESIKADILRDIDTVYCLTSRGYKILETESKLLGGLDKHFEGKS